MGPRLCQVQGPDGTPSDSMGPRLCQVKRANNVEIALSRLRLTNEEIKKAILGESAPLSR